MKRLTSAVLVLALLSLNVTLSGQEPDVVARSHDYWFAYVGKLPIGSTVRVRTADGERLTAILALVDHESITLEFGSRIPEPPRRIPFDRLTQLELKKNGSSLGKGIAIGAGIGAAGVLGFFALLIASLD